MAIKRVVDIGFWTDNKVINDFSPEDKYFMLYLLTNPHTTQLGIYEINIKQSGFEMGYDTNTILTLLDRFERTYGIIKYSRKTSEIAIINFLRHSIIKGGKPVEDLLEKELKKIKDKNLISFVFGKIAAKEDLNETVKKIIKEYQNNNENQNEIQNDNDNDNDVSYDDTYHDSSKPIIAKPIKHKYGEYKNVLLTDEELDKLKNEFPDYEQKVENLSSYIESKGAKYKSHLATIRNWAKKDSVPQKGKTAQELDSFYGMAKSWAERNRDEQ